MNRPKKRIFVLDTNVILHDSSCIYQFQEHDVVIPITVLEELDHFKKGSESLNFHAREFTRTLDELSGDKLFSDGVKIGSGLGRMMIKLDTEFHPDLLNNFTHSSADHNILNIAYHLHRDRPDKEVILVTKDVNLRMKAKAVGLLSQDYRNDHVKDIAHLYRGYRLIEDVNPSLIDQMYSDSGGFEVSNLVLDDELIHNEYLILRNDKKSALGFFDSEHSRILRVEKLGSYGIIPRNAGQIFALHALGNEHIKLVTISGKAGTGKTLLTLAAALEKRKQYLQIFAARPVIPMSNKHMGFLPGSIDAKLIPYMQPLYDNLGVIRNQYPESDKRHQKIQALLNEKKLKIEPLAFIRGRSLVRIFFIVDEAQNLTPHEIKTIITRAGEGTKIIFTGDIFQIDHPYLDSHSNGLSYLIEKMVGQKLYAHINLEKGERSELAELASNLL